MARIDLTMPKMGESVAEATIVKWCKNVGDKIDLDETILEIATDKVDSEVPSPVIGVLVEKLFEENAVVRVGAIYGYLETEVASPKLEVKVPDPEVIAKGTNGHDPEIPFHITTIPSSSSQEKGEVYNEITPELPGLDQIQSKSKPITDDHSGSSEDRFYSPLVRQIAKSEGISRSELNEIRGTGQEGRVTKYDILQFLDLRNTKSAAGSPSIGRELPPRVEEPKKVTGKILPYESGLPGDEIIEMDRMRRLISEHMIYSQTVSAHVTSFVEADVTNLVRWREKIKEEFKLQEKENITYTPIFIEAVARVLKSMPMVNVSVKENSIIVHKQINIGMATALPNGNLIVPVVKNADQKNLIGLTKAVNDLAGRARNGKLNPDDTTGGTFTLTNVGTFGNLMGTPIINQPQVAILATGAIVKKPSVLETAEGDVIAIRHKLFLSLSYDHRVVDGALGGSFLRKIADELESFDPHRKL